MGRILIRDGIHKNKGYWRIAYKITLFNRTSIEKKPF
jgi:hypothetical protein